MITFFRKHLFWKFFFSYFMLALVTMLVMGLVIRVLLPQLFEGHIARMALLLTQRGLPDQGHMMGDWSMMNSTGLFREIFEIFNQIIVEAFIFAIIPSILVALVLSAVMSRQFVRPLQEMGAAADRVAEGDYRERLPLAEPSPEYQDELQYLATRFNNMANRLEQIEDLRKQLIGDIAHELRTPLTVIKGSVEGLKDGVFINEGNTLDRIYRQADRLERLVDDLQELNFLEMGILELELNPIDISLFIENVGKMMEIKFDQKGVALSLDLEGNLPFAMADGDRLEQIMVNLLGNALRYTPTGGSVRIRAEEKPRFVQVSVEDTGIGIPGRHLENVFARFYRVDESRSRQDGGSGIGLTITKKLVEAHGGQIWAESEGEGMGAKFTFTLPKA